MTDHGLDKGQAHFTCRCGKGPITREELSDHMLEAQGIPKPGSQEWMDQADIALLNSAASEEEKAEAAARLTRKSRQPRRVT